MRHKDREDSWMKRLEVRSQSNLLIHLFLYNARRGWEHMLDYYTERRVQRIRKTLSPAGESLPYWVIPDALAARMGCKDQFSCGHPSGIMSEVAKLAPSYGGISYERFEVDGLQWPCPNMEHPGTGYLHKGQFTRGLDPGAKGLCREAE